MLHIPNPPFLGVFPTHFSRAGCKICPLWEYHQPHWIEQFVKFPQVRCHVRLVFLPVAFEEDELRKLHSPTNDGNAFQRLLEDDVNAAVHAGGICYVPQIHPVRIYLLLSH